MLGKPLEVLSFQEGRDGIRHYLENAGAWPLTDYVPLVDGTIVAERERNSCRGFFSRAQPDDDINYTVIALLILEKYGADFSTEDVAREWLTRLPAGATWTAERAAYQTLLNRMDAEFVNGAPPGFDLDACSDNPYRHWIGAQIRADLYGWVCPGRPDLAADMARRDAALSHRGDGIYGAMFIAALGAALQDGSSLESALDVALAQIPADSHAAEAVRFGSDLAHRDNAVDRLVDKYRELSPVHTLNNLALVVWALVTGAGDFGAAIGNAVSAGWDTDCNGATLGGLLGIGGIVIPERWTSPWRGRVGVSLAGFSEFALDELVARTVAVAESIDSGT